MRYEAEYTVPLLRTVLYITIPNTHSAKVSNHGPYVDGNMAPAYA